MPISRTRLPSLQRKLSPSDTRLTVQPSATGGRACCAEQLTGISQNRKGSRVTEERGMASGLHLVITGAGGLIGSALLPSLAADGHRITRMTRGAAGPGEISWDPDSRHSRSATAWAGGRRHSSGRREHRQPVDVEPENAESSKAECWGPAC